MITRIAFATVFLLQVSAMTAKDLRQTVVQVVHDSGMCWDPDVEFPIPCDDDDDD